MSPNDRLVLLSVLEPGMRPDFGPAGEGGLPTEGECKPDPFALERTQATLKELRSVAEGLGAKDVRATTLVSCVGGSHDMGARGGPLPPPRLLAVPKRATERPNPPPTPNLHPPPQAATLPTLPTSKTQTCS